MKSKVEKVEKSECPHHKKAEEKKSESSNHQSCKILCCVNYLSSDIIKFVHLQKNYLFTLEYLKLSLNVPLIDLDVPLRPPIKVS